MTLNNSTRREELVNCDVCNKQFTRYVTTKEDGTEQWHGYPTCGDCRNNQHLQERIKEAEQELPKVSQEQRTVWYDSCGLTGIFIDKTFANFKKELQPVAYEKLSNYKSGSLVLVSPDLYGVGKTHLVAALANKILQESPSAKVSRIGGFWKISCPLYFTTESKMLSRIRQSYNHKEDWETEEDIYLELAGYNLLIIDDVGKVRPRDYSFLQGVYFRLIDDRYVNGQNIILTSNLDLKEIEEHIGGACADRLREMCGKDGFIKMAGKSYRSLK